MSEVDEEMTGIAIIGLAGRFPGAESAGEFWQNLREGRDVGAEFSEEQLGRYVPEEIWRSPGYVRRGYVLRRPTTFDCGLFGYTPSEAGGIDPQQRKLLEVAWEALEDAGYAPRHCPGSVGVFASVSPSSLKRLDPWTFSSDPGAYMSALLGNDKDYAPVRVSYKLNLKGPAMSVQTACSSSLVAAAQACQSLLDYGCDMALAGGSNIIFPQDAGYLSMDEGGLSKDGRCHAFDYRASGMNFGNGVAVLVLKRLEDAVRDHDHVYGVIRGFAVNNDGSDKVGFTAPSVSGQQAVISEALEVSGIPAESVSYVETHGTGTPMGDPMEVRALAQVYGAGGPCELGAVKANVGHLNAAAGAAGLLKAALCLENAELPPLLHFERENPALGLSGTRFTVSTRLHPWTQRPRRCGVSSFGLGGTNCHMVLEEAPARDYDVSGEEESRLRVLPFSAKSESLLDAQMARFAGWAEMHMEASLADVAFTLQAGRESMPFRRAVLASSLAEAARKARDGVFIAQPEGGLPADGRRACFFFSGIGSQYAGMGRGLYQAEPAYRDAVDACAEAFLALADFDVRRVLNAEGEGLEEAEGLLRKPAEGFACLFAAEYAMGRLLQARGIEPACVGGHSFGQYAAAVFAGIFTLEDAARVVAKRGELMDRVQEGAMILVFAGEGQVRPLLFGTLSIAAVNTDRLCTVAGLGEEVDAFVEALRPRRIHCRKVAATRAGHSCLMEPILAEFRAFMESVPMSAPKIRMFSNATGTWLTGEEAVSPETWTRHIRAAVRFADDAAAVLADPALFPVEVGPGSVLTGMLRRHPQAQGREAVATMRDGTAQTPDWDFFQNALAFLYAAGLSPRWEQGEAWRVSLPGTVFEEMDFPVVREEAKAAGKGIFGRMMDKQDMADWFYLPGWKRGEALLGQAPGDGADSRCWLVFASRKGAGAGFVKTLERQGRRVVQVEPGEAFAREDGGFVLNPDSEAEFSRLFTEVEEMGLFPDIAVHAWMLGLEGGRGAEDWEACSRLGWKAIQSLLRAFAASHGGSRPLTLAVLADGTQCVLGNDGLSPEKAAALGPCLVAPAEYANVRSLSIDMEPDAGGAALESAVHDILSVPAGEGAGEGAGVMAYRAGFRWLQDFAMARPLPGAAQLLKEKGTYLVTGGFGGVASALAEHLAARYKANLVLTAHAPFPSESEWDDWLEAHGGEDRTSGRIRMVRRLEELGARVLAVSADIADRERMRQVWDEAVRRFGRVDGAFHAASSASSSMIQMQTPEKSAAVMGAKVAGTYVIEELARERGLDFVMLFSSLVSHVPSLGFSDYTSASLFMDAYARKMSGLAPWKVVAVNWGYWEGVGIGTALLPKLRELLGEDAAVRGIRAAEGMQCIERILASPCRQVAVSTSPYAALVSDARNSAKKSLASYSGFGGGRQRGRRPRLAEPYVAPGSDIEKVLCAVWQDMLGLDEVGVNDPYTDLGGDSLHAIPMISRIEEIFKIKVSLRSLLTENTVAKLARHLVSIEPRPGQAGAAAKIFIRIKSMSPEEMKALLEDKKKKQSASN